MPTPVKCKATVVSIQSFGTDVFKVDMNVDRRYTRFRPGQFLHLTLDAFDPTEAYWPESRVFSICSRPRTDQVSIVYSVKGRYTKRLKDELREGGEYWLKLPYGDFIIDQLVEDREDVVLIAGGTGISPFVPYLETSLDSDTSRQIYLAYAVRDPSRIVCLNTIQRARSSPIATVRIWSESPVQSHRESEVEVVTDEGVLDLSAVYSDTVTLASPHYFLSGPPGMLGAFRRQLSSWGVDPAKIHIDEWE